MEKLKLTELKQEAKKRGIIGYYKFNRKQLIDILSLPEVESVYEQGPSSIDERPNLEAQKIIVTLGGVADKPADKPAKHKTAIHEYLDSVIAIPVPDEIINKMSRSKLQTLDKQFGTKLEMFRNILRKEITGLLMVV